MEVKKTLKNENFLAKHSLGEILFPANDDMKFITKNWDKLLEERAEYSGELVLSDFTKNAIAKFKNK